MTLSEAVALQPAWVGYWLNVLVAGAFILPFSLLIWRQTRLAAILLIIANVIAAFSVGKMFEQMGYVKLLGLPHVILWTPLISFLVILLRRGDLPTWPKRILMIVMTVMLISLAFDYVDVLRYFAGETAPTPGTEPMAG